MRYDADIVASGVDEFRCRLRDARERLVRSGAGIKEELDSLTHEHAPEPAMLGLAAAVLDQLDDREQRELDEIDAAQFRIDVGKFGRCEDCGAPIGVERLRAMPAARYCLACQVRREA